MADILVVAIGCSNYIKNDWIKEGAIVIDCGINPFVTIGLMVEISHDKQFSIFIYFKRNK